MVMLATFKMFARGAKIKDPMDGAIMDIPMVSFVDDNTIAHTAEPEKTSEIRDY